MSDPFSSTRIERNLPDRHDLALDIEAVKGGLSAMRSLFLYCDQRRAELDMIDLSELVALVRDRVAVIESKVDAIYDGRGLK